MQRESKDTKWVIRIRKTKDRQHNIQRKNIKEQTTIYQTPSSKGEFSKRVSRFILDTKGIHTD